MISRLTVTALVLSALTVGSLAFAGTSAEKATVAADRSDVGAPRVVQLERVVITGKRLVAAP